MIHTHEERELAINRLLNNYLAIAELIEPPMRKLIYEHIEAVFGLGLDDGKERVRVFNDKSFYFEEEEREEKDIYVSDEACDAIKAEKRGSLSMTHNHPLNVPPSSKDYKFFFKYLALNDMAICGHVGNLYFISKGNRFNKIKEEAIVNFLGIFDEEFIKLIKQYFIDNNIRLSEEFLLNAKEKDRQECLAREYAFKSICEGISRQYEGFVYYMEGAWK
ncbi:MAG: hypothetical protein FWG91_06355 [Lachnospiraceae bacterium]|nr:hypothetical protein [Lachnospiraceae bacterium]